MAIPDTAGTTATFDGFSLMGITDLQVNFGEAQSFNVVSIDAPVRGTGTYAVPYSRAVVGMARPGTVSLTGLGVEGILSSDKIGWYGALVISHPTAGNVSTHAFLKSISRQGKVNDVWRYSVEFQITDLPTPTKAT